MIFPNTAALIAVATLFATSATADTARIGAGVSLFGPTVDVQVPLSDNITVGGSLAGGLSATGSTTIDGLDYSLSGNLGATSLMASYHLPGGLRLTGSVLMSSSSFSGTVTGAAGDRIGGQVVPSAFQVKSSAKFVNQMSPTLTVGFDIPILGMVLSSDLGVMKTGGLDVTLVETTPGGNVIPAADLAQAQADLRTQMAKYDILPYAGIMIGKWF